MSGLTSRDLRYFQYCLVLRAVGNLAKPYQAIAAQEPAFVDLPQELELGLREPLDALGRLRELQLFTEAQRADLVHLLDRLEQIRLGNDPTVYTRHGMQTSSEWEEVRMEAARVQQRHRWHEIPSREEFEILNP